MPDTKSKSPDLIYRDGKPAAVILEIEDYLTLLDQLEEADDLAYLRELRSRPLEFVSLEDLLRERPADV